MPDSAQFCPACGQRYTTGMVHLKTLIYEALGSVLNLEAKTFLTFRHLLIPGKLTLEFFRGRHKRYLTPLRLFFVTAILHFGVLAFLINKFAKSELRQFSRQQLEIAHNRQAAQRLDSLAGGIAREFRRGNPDLPAALDTLEKRFGNPNMINMEFGVLEINGSTITPRSIKVESQDVFTMDPDSLLAKLQITNWATKIQCRQIFRVYTEPDNFLRFVMGNLTWMVLAMMPAIALVLKLLYIRRRRYFVEHLIFSLHYHAFAFVIMSLAMLFFREEPGLLVGLAFITIGMYALVAMRQYYRQGWFKTLFKFTLLHNAYFFIFSVFVAFSILISALLY